MNALVTFRENFSGKLTPNTAQREAAREQITANLRTRLEAILRQSAAKSAAAVDTTDAAKSAAVTEAKSTESTSADTSTTETKRTGNNELDRDAFLRLLVLEMQQQDPLQPYDNAQMIAQLAQFSSLEQMNKLNESFEAMAYRLEYVAGNLDQLNFISAQGMLGKYVEGIDSDGEALTGLVDSVTLAGSIVILGVGDKTMPMTGVLAISNQVPEDAS
jgi:flagellar basal-body rod modification protein FlgD